MLRRLRIFLLTLFVLSTNSGLSSLFVIPVQASESATCVGTNVTTLSYIYPANDVTKYRVPLVGYIPISDAPRDGHSGKEAFDFSVKKAPVVAARGGTVKWKDAFPASGDGYGYHIEIWHDDDERSIYAHLSQRIAPDGATVKQGDLIGYSGNSGLVITDPQKQRYHLHFEVKKKDSDRKYVNIRRMVGIHLFAYEQKDQSLDCDVQMPYPQNDGYATGTPTSQVGTSINTAYNCELSYKGVIVYDADECQGNYLDAPYNQTVINNFAQMQFQPSSLYIAPGWSAFIDDGNLTEKNHLCATRSLWDFNVDYYHPVANRLIAGHVNRLIAFNDTTCGGRGINEHGQLNDLSQYPPYIDNSSDTGGGQPPTPGDSTTPPNPDPASNVGVRFFTEKQYQGSNTKLGYGTHDFSTNFLSVQMDRNDMHFFVYDSGGGRDCFDYARFNNSTQYPSFNDHGDWWDKTIRVSVESGVCPGSPDPNRKVTFYSEKQYQGSSWQKQVGFDGGMTDNFYSVRIDEGISFILTNTFGQPRCFDKYSFNGNNEYPSFNDHGDWWDNTVAVKVQSFQCPPAAPNFQSPGVNATVPYGNVVVQYQPYLGSESIRGELHGLPQVWYFSQPESVTSWNLGALPAGSYTVKLWAVSSHGTSDIVTRNFTVAQPNCSDLSFEQIAVFTETACHGRYIALEPGWWSFTGSFYKNISSIFIPQGWSAEVIQNGNTSDGPAQCLNWSMWDLATDNFHQSDIKIGDNIESIIIFNVPNCGRQSPDLFCQELSLTEVAIFDYTYCKGPDRVLPTGTHILYGFNDLASSMFIPSGKSVKVWRDYFTGPHACWTGSKWILALDLYYGLAENADNNISVVEVFDDDHCGTPKAPELYPVTGSYGDYDVIAPNTYVEFWWSDVGADAYKFELWTQAGEFVYSSDRDAYTLLDYASNLSEGTYIWKVKSIVLGYESPWAERTLTVRTQTQEDTCYDKIPQSGAAVFENRYCGGESQTLGEGTHDFSGTAWNDVISSITLADGYSVLISEHKAGEVGGMRCITGWMWDFAVDTYTTTGGVINDTITVVDVQHNPNCNGWTPPTTLQSPTNLKPQTAQIVYGQVIDVSWDAVPGATSYEIVLTRQDNGSISTWTVLSNVGKFTPGASYPEKASYKWRVRAVVGETKGPWSESANFTLVDSVSLSIYLPLINR